MAAKIKTIRPVDKYRHKPRGINKHAYDRVYWPYLPLLLIIVLLLAAVLPTASQLRKPTSRVLSYATGISQEALLKDTNEQRLDHQVAQLQLNAKLETAAQAKANDMATKDYWSHNTPDGNPPWIFVTAQKYTYQKLGENLAAGFNTPQGAIDGWMFSPSHRENLLDPAFSDVGFGFANIPNYSAAGGGPMTVIVAFYGQRSSTNLAAAPSRGQNSSVLSTQATNTESPVARLAKADTFQASRGQLAMSNWPFANISKALITIILLAAASLWITKHLFTLRRVFAYGEKFAVHHPLFDVCLLLIVGLSYLLTQTAGLVK